MRNILAVLFPVILFCSCQSLPEYHEKPAGKYEYYSGGTELGNHYCKIQYLRHQESNKTVSLIGMIHTADASFYKQIDEELDKADVVLNEGIHGLPSFGIHKYFSMYAFSVIERFTYLQGLLPQNQGLKTRDNGVSADMSSDDFSSQGTPLSTLLQAIALPVMIAVSEPYCFILNSKKSLAKLISDKWHNETKVELRHQILQSMNLSDTPADTLLPGIIDSRNKIVIEKLHENLNKAKVSHIAIPWGAAHMPTLEHDLLKNGFEKCNTPARWLRSIAVKDLQEAPGEFTDEVCHQGIPWIYSVENYKNDTEVNFLFSLISWRSAPQTERFSLIYDDLFYRLKYKNISYINILPRIYGKPLLFDYACKDDKTRLRFLWFFKFGSLE
ncbi:MAG: hypothetical protein HRT88_20210 [Lentisphaeraceae bacterium]|nr:hypothetical protein [Lentisphaeraceae bacterium]